MASYTVFGASTPTLTDLNDSDDYALGTVVRIGATANGGQITHARWYFPGTAPSGPIPWRVSDLLTLDFIGSHVFAGTGPGWVEEALAVPIEVPPEGMDVLLWIGTPDRYVATTNYFTSGPGSAGITNGPLTAPASGSDPAGVGNGRFGGDDESPPAGTISGGNYYVDLVFTDNPEPPSEGAAAFTLDLALAGSGEAPAVPPAEGSAAIGLELALAGAGDAPPIDPGEGSAAFGIEYALAGTGETPAVTPNEGSAALSLELALAGTGSAPDPETAEGSAALGIAFSFSGTGETPDPGEASGAAQFSLGLALAGAGLNPAPGGSAAFTLALALAAAGDNDTPFVCRPVKSFAEVMP